MNILIMAGGRGSRLGGLKKPFLSLCRRRLIDVVINVAKSLVKNNEIYLCICKDDVNMLNNAININVILCPGQGYVEDLIYAFQITGFPTLVLPADMPFLTREVVERFLSEALHLESDVVTLMVCNKNECKESGISLFRKTGGSWSNVYFEEDIRLRDIDTYEDLVWAEKLCESMEGIEERD